MNQFNSLRNYESDETPRECNGQPPEVHFKSITSPPKTSTIILDIMVRVKHDAIDYGDVRVRPSDYTFESIYKCVPDPETNPIKSIDDDEMDQLLKLLYQDYDDDILDHEIHMLQA